MPNALGPLIAEWLRRRVDPSTVYDHRILHELADANIVYDENTGTLSMSTGELVFVPSYTPAELVNHPVVIFRNVNDAAPRQVVGFEVAEFLHLLLWPAEMPPGNPQLGWVESFNANVESLAARNGLPYRDDPPGGWWRDKTPTRRKRA